MRKFKGILKSFENKATLWVILLLLALGSVFSALIPPFQSPDEFNHIKRAYLLTKGQILLKSTQGQPAGGEIDTGLLSYFDGYQRLPFNADKKISKEEDFAVSSIKWSEKQVFSPLPNMGYYFPLAYAPQALGLGIGESLGLSVRNSYRLGRFFVLTFSLIMLAIAFAIFPANACILGLLILPMSIFQFCSASLEGFTNAVTVLCIGLFMRGGNKKFSFPGWMSYLLVGCILLLTTSRMQLLPLLILPLFVWFVRKERAILWQFFIVTGFSLIWSLVSVKATYLNRGASDYSTSQIILFYIKHPTVLFYALQNTIETNIWFYRDSFIGVLGWLDTRFDDYIYLLLSGCLVLLVLFSISLKSWKDDWQPRIILVGSLSLSFFLVFFSQVVCWNSVPVKIIEGVQGRYFIAPLVLLGYALSGSSGFFEGIWKKFAIIPLVLMGIMVILYLPKTLIERYYMAPYETAYARSKMEPSAQLDIRSPIKILMTSSHSDEQVGLKRIGVMFGTYIRRNPGEAELRLKGQDGIEFVQRFSLSALADNKYRYFDLDAKRYRSGEILSVSGVGVSTWENHDEKGGVNTCIIYEYVNGKMRFTPGCPIVSD